MAWKVEIMATLDLTQEVNALRDRTLAPEDVALLFALTLFAVDHAWSMRFLDLTSYSAIENSLEALSKVHKVCI